MSPAQILERCYRTLKQRLIEGEFNPGQRLEAARLADDMHVSITPVRDVLNRLTGEGLIGAVAGGGFYVPVPDEGSLRDLLDWNIFLALHAARARRSVMEPFSSVPQSVPVSVPERSALLFARLSLRPGNRQFLMAVENLNDKLHPMRLLDERILDGAADELVELEKGMEAEASIFVKRIRQFHKRRKAKLPTYVRLMRMPSTL